MASGPCHGDRCVFVLDGTSISLAEPFQLQVKVDVRRASDFADCDDDSRRCGFCDISMSMQRERIFVLDDSFGHTCGLDIDGHTPNSMLHKKSGQFSV